MRIQILALVPLLALVSPAPSAHADTYQLYQLSTADFQLVGLSSSGTAVTMRHNACGSTNTSGNCYETFENGALIATSATAPGIAYDNGLGCSPGFGPAFSIQAAKCNGARTAAYAEYASGSTHTTGIFTGPDPLTDEVYVEGALVPLNPQFDLNSMGDILYVGYSLHNDYELYDLTAHGISPEPSSLVLLGTGLLGVAGAARRRFLSR